MQPASACCVIVVAETDKLNRLASSAVDKMGSRVRLGRAVKAAVNPAVVFRDGLASLRDLSRLMDAVSLEERKELIRTFISGVTVPPDEARLDVMVAQIPALAANLSVGVVAGARYTPLQVDLKPLNRYLAGLRRAA